MTKDAPLLREKIRQGANSGHARRPQQTLAAKGAYLDAGFPEVAKAGDDGPALSFRAGKPSPLGYPERAKGKAQSRTKGQMP